MKRHALFFATAITIASLGTAGLASAQPATSAADSPSAAAAADAPRAMKGERMKRHGVRHGAHRHAMHGGIARMDTDGDGRISRAEFDAANADTARKGAFDFDAIDADADGYIVRTEAMALRERLRTQMREQADERRAAAFAAADLNGDGRLGRVEVDEKMPRLSKRFAWMDDNRDGFLDRAEFEAGRKR